MSGVEPPAWFTEALAAPRTSHAVNVPGDDGQACRIVYHHFPYRGRGAPPQQLLFVHGGSACAHWWTHLIPSFLDMAEAVALDLGGMGESEHRASYSEECYVRELLAVAEHAGLSRPLLVAHSFGGFVAAAAGALSPGRFSGALLVDSVVWAPGDELDYGSDAVMSLAARKVYPDFETLRSRFKLVPQDTHANPWIKEHLLRHSFIKVPGGYMWRYDPNRRSLGVMYTNRRVREAVRNGFPFGVVFGEASLGWTTHRGRAKGQREMPRDSRAMAFLRGALPQGTPFVGLPGATHHCMVDEPVAVAAALLALLQHPAFLAPPGDARARL